jgi:hypothetical protein
VFKSEILKSDSKVQDSVKGILKSSWMVKHLHDRPSVIVLCVSGRSSYEENEVKKLKDHIKKKVEIIQNNCKSHISLHHCQLFIFLSERKKHLNAENQELLRQLSDVKFPLMVMFDDDEYGVRDRIMSSIYKLSKNYYEENIRNYDERIENLRKENSKDCILLARAYFKCAYFNEFKKEYIVALKFEYFYCLYVYISFLL